MELIEINGINILFPYKPYDIQIDYMKSVINCLQKKSNGLLESPTGTGKTLSLLCSTLGWLDSQNVTLDQMLNEKNENNLNDKTKTSSNGWQLSQTLPKIMYSSRTHSQLSQACNELKRTHYKTFASVVIGSRDQLCLNSEVRQLETITAKNQSCRHKIASNSCQYYRNYEQKVNRELDYTENKVFDIEDLVQLGQKHTCCPYYASRLIKNKASVVFTPYNYILDPTIRRMQSLDLRNAVIIFDEGHNIERMCEESVSTQLKSETLAICIKHINTILEKLKQINDGTYEGSDYEEYADLQPESVAKIKETICELELAIDKLIRSHTSVKTTHKTELIFELMERVGLGFENCGFILEIIDKISMVLLNSKTMNATTSFLLSNSFTSLSEFIERLIPISLLTTESYESYKIDFIKKFKIFSEKGGDSEENNKNNYWVKKSSPNSWILHIWCLSASIGTKALMDLGIHNMIITSGTLAPLNSFEVEMGLEFPIKLQNSHVIKENQLSIMNIAKSSDNVVLTSKYDNKDNMDYYRALGNTLIDLFRVIPKGVLIFFSSYTSLNKSIQVWKENDKWRIWDTLNSLKQIFLEPRNKQAFVDCMLKYKNRVDEHNSNGAAFLGVCRGKLSEGLDLTNDYCRGVIMTGLPFPSIADPRVILKKQYLNELKSKQLSGDGWYTLQMKRALNQAIGRVVRHRDDFGAIVLVDSRFTLLNDGLSKWVEKFIVKGNSDYRDKLRKLESFFAQHNSKNNFSNYSAIHNKTDDFKAKPIAQSNNFRKFQKTSSNNGLTDEIIIINEFKSSQTIKKMSGTSFKPKSIFDSLNYSNACQKTNESKRSCDNSSALNSSFKSPVVIDLEFSPNKRKKLNVPLKSVYNLTPTEAKAAQTSGNKFQGIMKKSSLNDSNSSKKVHWNEHQLTEASKVELLNENSVDGNVESTEDNNDSNDELLQVWRKIESELKELFENSNKFSRLCETIRKFKKYKNVIYLASSLNSIFINVEKEKREKLIKEISIIVPNAERHNFLRNMKVKVSNDDLRPLKEFKVVKRKDNLIDLNHSCMYCKLTNAITPHRTLCCGFVACHKCFKIMNHKNCGKCYNCKKSLKMSDLKHLRFKSVIY